MKIELQSLVDQTYKKYLNLTIGEPASYIPELKNVNHDLFAIAIVDVHGEKVYSVGDVQSNFTLQSTSKPVVYGLALTECGESDVRSRIGVEPTGEVFNSIIELEEKSHRPFNPMINSGAIAITSLIKGESFSAKLQKILDWFELFVGHKVQIDENVFLSEKKTAHRNRAIAHLMKHFNVIDSDIEETLDLYFKQCSILVNCVDLGWIAATYANQGTHPLSKKSVLDSAHVIRTLSLMFTCGMYDTAGEWAYQVGLPAKSGVSGALFAVVPGRYGIAVYSPRIDEHGHSYRGQAAMKFLAQQLNLNIFGSQPVK